MSNETPDGDRKLGELILYIAWLSEGDPFFGRTKLNKLLYHCDFRAFVALGQAITGVEYQHLGNGPAPRRFIPVEQKLFEEKAIAAQDTRLFNRFEPRRVRPLRDPDMSTFTSEQVAIIDQVIAENRNKTGTQMSDESHNDKGWQLTQKGETIPYFAALLDGERSGSDITEEEMRHAEELAERYPDT